MENLDANLLDLTNQFSLFLKNNPNTELVSEETIRSWLNKFLGLFGWDVTDVSQVQQEIQLAEESKEKLKEIASGHIRPDYSLVNGPAVKAYFDAKSLDIDCFSDNKAAFQVKSYGWSAKTPFAFLSNFKQLVIYDCRPSPQAEDASSTGIVLKIGYKDYVKKIDILKKYLLKAEVYKGSLDKLAEAEPRQGVLTIDEKFADFLSNFRKTLAINLLKNNPALSSDDLNFYLQVIIDRIIFIRVCEARGIEKPDLLKTFLDQGFWENFSSSCYMDFYEHYDGAMFERNEGFQKLVIDDSTFSAFIEQLYYPYPYCFDAIPSAALAKIYESFLSKQISVTSGKVFEQLKDDYIKTNGAIPTPEYLAKEVVLSTFQLNEINDVETLLKVTVLDPCCGSGVFLIEAFDLLSEKLISLLRASKNPKYKDLFLVTPSNEFYLTVKGKQLLMQHCIFGIDLDPIAVEISKMSLALKIVDGNNQLVLSEAGYFGEKILQSIHKNLLVGNSLVEPDMIQIDAYQAVRPLNIKQKFSDVFRKGGFDYVIGNPPYVETKYYKASNENLHKVLRKKYTSFHFKADLSVLFIERSISLLNSKGILGFIVQKRWFKAKYGEGIRQLIASKKRLKRLISYKSTSLFSGRSTYVAILVVSPQPNKAVEFANVLSDGNEIKNDVESGLPPVFESIPCSFFQQGTWSPESFKIESLRLRCLARVGSLKQKKYLAVKDGIQALWKKIYHLSDCVIDGKTITGTNGLGKRVTIEKAVVRPLIYNRAFYPLKKLTPDAYSVFPYEEKDNKTKIRYSDLSKRFPLCYAYLNENKQFIKDNIECRDDPELWHTFTREHNQNLYWKKKVIIPMTSKCVAASFYDNGGIFVDNANVWYVVDSKDRSDVLKIVSLILNSRIFDAFAKAKANPQANDYFKFNKQFLEPVPFPDVASISQSKKKSLLVLYEQAKTKEAEYLTCSHFSKENVQLSIEEIWKKIDDIVVSLYGLTKEEAELICSSCDDVRFALLFKAENA